jgi:hypothetical protein
LCSTVSFLAVPAVILSSKASEFSYAKAAFQFINGICMRSFSKTQKYTYRISVVLIAFGQIKSKDFLAACGGTAHFNIISGSKIELNNEDE